METTLNGKVALITGASRGIGLAIARAYAAAGAKIALASRKQHAPVRTLEQTGAPRGTSYLR